MFRPTGPDLLAPKNEVVAFAARGGLEGRRVRAARGFRDAKSLQPKTAGRDLGKVATFLGLGAVSQDRPHCVHLGVTGAAVATPALDFLQHRGRC